MLKFLRSVDKYAEANPQHAVSVIYSIAIIVIACDLVSKL